MRDAKPGVMSIRLRAKDGSTFEVPGLTPCVALPKKYSYDGGLSRIEAGWAIFDAGQRSERRCPARVTTVAQVPDLSVVLVNTGDDSWWWTQVCRHGIPRERFELLEVDDAAYEDEEPAAPDELAGRFTLLELD
jgi:hypothetical protein